MSTRKSFESNPRVFFPAVIVIALFLVFGARFTDTARVAFGFIQDGIVHYFGWFYILAVAFFLVFVVYLAFSRYGSVRLGPDDSRPEYSYLSWFAMLFSAGMGIGLVYFAVAEPIFHYVAPPVAGAETAAAATEAMRLTFFHWGFHAWAIYIVVGLSLAYFSFRKGLPLAIRSVFYPLLGERIHGPIGNVIDILAVFGTLFGVATSLGLGVMQVNAGLAYMIGVPIAPSIQIGLIIIITSMATVSVVLGLNRGIRRLSNFNMVVAGTLLALTFVLGPTVFILGLWAESIGNYFQNIIADTFRLNVWVERDWHASWTLFYWGWWIAWSPFVGMFIARISRGRTIREFIAGVLLIPVAFTSLWMTVFGGSALHLELLGPGGLIGRETEEMLFGLFQALPLTELLAVLAMLVVVAFFVTSSDSASLVIGMIASGGRVSPSTPLRIFWAVLEGAVAGVLLLAGGLGALRTAAIATGLPFAVVLLIMCFSLHKALRREGPISSRRGDAGRDVETYDCGTAGAAGSESLVEQDGDGYDAARQADPHGDAVGDAVPLRQDPA